MDYFMLAVIIETFFFLLFIIAVKIGIYFFGIGKTGWWRAFIGNNESGRGDKEWQE